MRTLLLVLSILGLCALLSACGTRTLLLREPAPTSKATVPQAGQKIGFPAFATKNTTRVAGGDPVADAAGVALAVFPSAAPGSHPTAVTLAPTDDWEAAIASAVLMAPPIRAPILLSGSSSLPSATADALSQLAPTGSSAINGSQLIRVGDVPQVKGMRASSISGSDPFALAASIDRYVTATVGKPTNAVVVASANDPSYAMPAAGWAAESGDPVLFVTSSGIPSPTKQALVSHQHPQIYVLGPPSAVPDKVLRALGRYGKVKRIGASDPAANSVAFAIYRDPPCVRNQPCAHVPGSFGWAMRSPGHGYTLINANRPLDAAASAALSGSGDFGPQLLIDKPTALPQSVMNFFLNYATPGYTQEGPTAAVYNHGWVIGDQDAISVPVQSEVDTLLQAIPQK